MKGGTNSLSNVDIFSETLPFVKIERKFLEKTRLPSARPTGISPAFRTHESLCGPADHDFPPLNKVDGKCREKRRRAFSGAALMRVLPEKRSGQDSPSAVHGRPQSRFTMGARPDADAGARRHGAHAGPAARRLFLKERRPPRGWSPFKHDSVFTSCA